MVQQHEVTRARRGDFLFLRFSSKTACSVGSPWCRVSCNPLPSVGSPGRQKRYITPTPCFVLKDAGADNKFLFDEPDVPTLSRSPDRPCPTAFKTRREPRIFVYGWSCCCFLVLPRAFSHVCSNDQLGVPPPVIAGNAAQQQSPMLKPMLKAWSCELDPRNITINEALFLSGQAG